jgi:hypothetical protein
MRPWRQSSLTISYTSNISLTHTLHQLGVKSLAHRERPHPLPECCTSAAAPDPIGR